MEHSFRDLNDMAVFAEIVSTGSISAAAKKIGLPKSNVSRRLARLELRLGVQLIERNTRSSRLTSVGKSYAYFCKSMVEEADAADNIIAKSFDGPTGDLKISASILVGQQILAQPLANYMQKYPEVIPSLVLTNHRVNLIEDGFDIAFRIGINEDSSLISLPVGSFPQRLYASPKYLEIKGTPKSPDELSSHDCLVMSDARFSRSWHLTNGEENIVLDMAARPKVNDFNTLKTMGVNGAGIALMPISAVFNEVSEGSLRPILEEWQGPVSELNAIYPSRRGATTKVRLLIEEVKQHISSLNIL